MEKINTFVDKRAGNSKIVSLEKGKLPPQAVELEEAVLGAMMIDKKGIDDVIDILQPDAFYDKRHQEIYAAIYELFQNTKPIDLLTVSSELKKKGSLELIGGDFYLIRLTQKVASSAHIEFHSRIILEKYIQRRLITISSEIIENAYDETSDVFDLLDDAEGKLFEVTQGNLKKSSEDAGSLVKQALKKIQEIGNQEGMSGLETGFTKLDALTSGWQPSDLIIIAARPGMGKTAFVISMAKNMAIDFKHPVAVFSLEMSSVQLITRMISSETGLTSEKLRKGNLEAHEWEQLNVKVKKLSDAPIFIDDTPSLSIFDLRAKARRLVSQHGVKIIVIDYLQLMTAGGSGKGGGNREQEISTISRNLKALAKELAVPVIALSQLSRAVETRGGSKRPLLSDLRECITGDTLIYLPETGEYKPVAELEGQNGFEVLAMDENYKLQPAKCLGVWKTGNKEIYEIVTQSGNKIRASLNHPFFTINGWQQVIDLKVGDSVATARNIISNAISGLKDEEIIILGHMIGEGCYVERQAIHYTSQDTDSLDIVEKAAKNLWNSETRRVKDKPTNKCYHIYIPSPYHLTHGVHHPFINLLTKCGGKKARSNEKTIPSEIFKGDNRQVALFIKHLWATDGGVFIRKNKGSHKFHYSSNSIGLIQGLRSLLLRFGIQSSVRKSQKAEYLPNYQLSITGKENCLKFAYEIGIFGAKAEKVATLIRIFESQKTNPNVDVISKKIWTNIRSLKKEKGFTERSFQAALEIQYCGTALYKSNVSRNRLQKVANILENEQLENIANSAIFWEKIVSIAHVSNEETYDIHVENHHNFVANNFIIHNSGAIEQDADIVSFIFRPEYYGLTEWDDHETTPCAGQGEFIVAKHRNGGLENIRLKFTGHLAKFSDLDEGFNSEFQSSMNESESGSSDILSHGIEPKDAFGDSEVPF